MEELFQFGHQHQANKAGGEAAVIQAEAAVEVGHRGDQQVVQAGGQHTEAPAVLIRNGAQAVGIAQANHNSLGIDGSGEIAAQQRGQPAKQEGSHHIAGHNRPNIGRMRAGVTAGQHAEDDTEGHTVEAGTDGVVVSQDHQAVYTHVHQHHGIAVGSGEGGDLVGVLQQDPIVLGSAAQNESKNNAQAEQHTAENVDCHLGGKFASHCGSIRGSG